MRPPLTIISDEQWVEIKRKFESGEFSTREIARQYYVRDKRITDRAEKEGWIRNFAYPSTKKKKVSKEPPLKYVDPTIEWPIRHLDKVELPGQVNPPMETGFHDAVKKILGEKPEVSIVTTDTPECGPEIPQPYTDKTDKAVYTERYEAIRLELTRRRHLAKANRLDEDTLVKLIDRVGALDTEGAVEQLITARMQINADTLARTAELKAIRDRYMSMVCDMLGPDAGKAAIAATVLLASRNDSIQGAIKLIADLDKLITDAERKAFDMDKPVAKIQPKNRPEEEKPFDISTMTTEQLAALNELVAIYSPQKQSKELPLPPIEMDE